MDIPASTALSYIKEMTATLMSIREAPPVENIAEMADTAENTIRALHGRLLMMKFTPLSSRQAYY